MCRCGHVQEYVEFSEPMELRGQVENPAQPAAQEDAGHSEGRVYGGYGDI